MNRARPMAARLKSTFRKDLTEIKFTITLSTFETIDCDNKREYESFVSMAL